MKLRFLSYLHKVLENGASPAEFTCDEGDSARYGYVIKTYAKVWNAATRDTRWIPTYDKYGF